jgi:ferrochelatase
LIEEYGEIGGSPLNGQSEAQAAALEAELADRGHDVETYVGLQFMEPLIEDAAERARGDGVEHVVGLPVYPLCGPSTNVASLDKLEDAVEDADWEVELTGLTGWHTHPEYTRLRADNVRSFVETRGLSLDGDTRLVFSAHGTPQYYLDEGSRYVQYVEEYCATLAAILGVERYELGYQNLVEGDVYLQPWEEYDTETDDTQVSHTWDPTSK